MFRASGPDRFEAVPDLRASRGLATINVSREDKEVFDAIQVWLQYQRGMSLSQWDVFSFLLGAALESQSAGLAQATLMFSDGAA